jgi:hypothetical protein
VQDIKREERKEKRNDVEGEEEKGETSSVKEDNSEERNRCNHTRGNNNEIFEISPRYCPNPTPHPHIPSFLF